MTAIKMMIMVMMGVYGDSMPKNISSYTRYSWRQLNELPSTFPFSPSQSSVKFNLPTNYENESVSLFPFPSFLKNCGRIATHSSLYFPRRPVNAIYMLSSSPLT